MTRRRQARAAVLLGGAALLAWPFVSAASGADTTTQTISVTDRSEGWYASSPVDICTTPLGCPPSTVPTSPYPTDTLHVGVAAGQETSRSYLVPDLSALPFDATSATGTLTLPVATGNQDGTAQPGSAHLQACLAKTPVAEGTNGSTSTPPAVDCSTTATLTYDAGKSVFTLDLTPFLTAWIHGTPQNGIALIPSKTTQQTDAWHVAFNGHKRTGTSHVSGTVTVTAPVADDGSTGVTTPVPPAPAVPPAPVTVPPAPTTVQPGAAPPVVAPASQQPVAAPVQPVAFTRSFQYPMAFLLPIVLLGAGVFLVRLFTRDATPMRPAR